jgi:anti-sigma-K factor RskA
LVVSLQASPCPVAPDEIAEAYVMGTLCTDEALTFEDHYIACNSCATVVENAAAYLDAMRTTARKLRPEPMRAASSSSTY